MALTVLLAVVGLLGPGVAGAPGQAGQATEEPAGSVLEARLEAVIPGNRGSVPVRLEFRVAPSPSTRVMPVTLLQMDPARVAPLRVSVDGRGVQVTMREERPRFFSGEIPLPGPAPARGPLQVVVQYDVIAGWDEGGRLVVPVVAPAWTPADPNPRSFIATVRIPAGMGVASTFPTSVLSSPRGAEGGEVVIALQAVPSVLNLRTSLDGSPGLTLEGVLDRLVVAVLLVMLLLGIRFIRRPE